MSKTAKNGGNMLEFINDNIVSVVAPVMLLGAGFWFSLKLKFFYIFHPMRIIKSMTERKNSGGISPFRAVTLALAGTLGVVWLRRSRSAVTARYSGCG